jgi:P-type Ca2+ transporter type 2C
LTRQLFAQKKQETDMKKGAQACHAQTVEEVLQAFEVDPQKGLTEAETGRRRESSGKNELSETKKRNAFAIFIAQFRSLVILILAAAALLAFSFGKINEGIAVSAVILINSLIGFFSEWRATRSMDALRATGQHQTRVIRGGKEQTIAASELVPGDICLCEAGDKTAADLRLIEANKLRVNEAALTGESVPVNKQVEAIDADRVLAERSNMLYRGTTLSDGSAKGVVVAIGMQTELGHIAQLAKEAGENDEAETTPIERHLNRLGSRLAWLAIGLALVIGITGVLVGKSVTVMVETAIALGVAAIPEGLPFVATIGLARGMWLMAKRKALINRLPAVETLGSADLILVDKTGTITENRMEAAILKTAGREYTLQEEQPSDEMLSADPSFRRALEIGVLCNNASYNPDNDERQGDPTEAALLQVASLFDLRREELTKERPEEREVAFDPDSMMMATFNRRNDTLEIHVKGAPEAVIPHCTHLSGHDITELDDEARNHWMEAADSLASKGLRVLALAEKSASLTDEEPYEGLTLTALIGLQDPPREDIRPAIERCHRAGIRVVMITGDQPRTAHAIARQTGIITEDDDHVLTGNDLGDLDDPPEELKQRIQEVAVFARVDPEQKLKLMRLFRAAGHRVAMSGDGVNDAPALREADIGVAMGKRGTDAAKENADMILKNDAFSAILSAIEQGRVFFGNIRNAVIFMLCTNGAEVLAVGLASLLNWPLPLRPLQILYLNVITDIFPALALSVGKGNPEAAMKRPPRPADEDILEGPQWRRISFWSLLIAGSVLAVLMTGKQLLQLDEATAITLSFLTLAFAKLWFVFSLRDPDTPLIQSDVVRNRWMWPALAGCVVLLFCAVYLPGLNRVLETAGPGWQGWGLVLSFSLLPVLAGMGLERIVTKSIRRT